MFGFVPSRKFSYGVSLAYGPELTEQMARGISAAGFESVQLPESDLHSDVITGSTPRSFMHKVDVCDLFPLSLTHSIAGQSSRIIDGFTRQFSQLVDLASKNNYTSLTVDFDLASGMNDSERLEKRIQLLKRLAPKLYGKDISLCFPVRIPQVGEDASEFMMRCLEKAMCPYCQLCVDIHPHELDKGFSPKKLIRWLQFDMKVIRFIYEPEAGNQLVKNIVAPWIELLRENCFDGSVVFAPVISDELHFSNELNSLQQIVSELEQL